MTVLCPACNHTIKSVYMMLGVETVCPSCGKSVRLEQFASNDFPNTGYEITFSDFQQLLNVASYRPGFKKFLSQNLELKIRETNNILIICSTDGEALDLLSLHLRIQNEPSLQLSIYRLAMSLWR